MSDDIPAGSRWREKDTGKVIVTTGAWANVGPWWYYEDDPGRTPWHCCVEDFVIWDRFERLT